RNPETVSAWRHSCLPGLAGGEPAGVSTWIAGTQPWRASPRPEGKDTVLHYLLATAMSLCQTGVSASDDANPPPPAPANFAEPEKIAAPEKPAEKHQPAGQCSNGDDSKKDEKLEGCFLRRLYQAYCNEFKKKDDNGDKKDECDKNGENGNQHGE